MNKILYLIFILLAALLVGCEDKQVPISQGTTGTLVVEEPLDNGLNDLDGLSVDFDDSNLDNLDQDLDLGDI